MKTKSLRLAVAFALAFVFSSKAQTGPPPWTNHGSAYVCFDLSPGFFETQSFSAAKGQSVGFGTLSGGSSHALLWLCGGSSVVDLHPSGFYNSQANYTSGTQQVGEGDEHALLWSGSADSVVDLHPAGYSGSEAFAVCGNEQVGMGWGAMSNGFAVHALLWFGSASTVVDLNPPGFEWSYALGTSGGQQAGYGATSGPSGGHAVLWSGTAASAVDLNPTGYVRSAANGISGGQQVGVGWGPATGFNFHALLWYGSAASAVDLNPAGWTASECWGCYSNYQVGDASWNPPPDGFYEHAMLWSGTPDSAVDLHQFLSSNYVSSSAHGIDENGNIVGWASGVGTWQHAIEWVPLPKSMVISNDPGVCGAVWTLANCAISSMCSPPSGTFLPIGTNLITCTVTNSASSNAPIIHTFTVTVKDCEPPKILATTASPQVLWPPNNQMQPVRVNVSATDNCHVAGSKIISVTSNESDGNTDWQITGDLTVNLRASRFGNGAGRVYTITVQCMDDSGNASTNTVSVTAPRSLGEVGSVVGSR